MNSMTSYQPPTVVSMDDMERMAIAIAKSGLFGVREPNQALALMLLAQAEGMHPATAARDFHIINGRPSMKAETMMARFQQDGGIVKWEENSDTRACGCFSHPSCPDPVRVEWTLETARQAELLGNKMWQKYPRAMLRSRVVSEGIRTVRPGVLMGMYTDEEVRSFTEPATAADQTPKCIEPEPAPALKRDLDAELAACTTVADCRIWLAGARQYLGLKPVDAGYKSLTKAAEERVNAIKASISAENEGEV